MPCTSEGPADASEVRSAATVWQTGDTADTSAVFCVRVLRSIPVQAGLASAEGAIDQHALYMRSMHMLEAGVATA